MINSEEVWLSRLIPCSEPADGDVILLTPAPDQGGEEEEETIAYTDKTEDQSGNV